MALERFNLNPAYGPTVGGTTQVLLNAALDGYSFKMIGPFKDKADDLTQLIANSIAGAHAVFVSGTRGSGKSQLLTQVASALAQLKILPIIVTVGQEKVGDDKVTFSMIEKLVQDEFKNAIELLMGKKEIVPEFRQYLDEAFDNHIKILNESGFGDNLLKYCDSEKFSLAGDINTGELGFYGALEARDREQGGIKIAEEFRIAVIVDDLDKRSEQVALSLLKTAQKEFQALLARPGALIVLSVQKSLMESQDPGMDYIMTRDKVIDVPLLSDLTIDDIEQLALHRLRHLVKHGTTWRFDPTKAGTIDDDMKKITKRTGCPDLSHAKHNMAYAVMKSVASAEARGRDSVRSFYRVLNSVINHGKKNQIVNTDFLAEVLKSDGAEMENLVIEMIKTIYHSTNLSKSEHDQESIFETNKVLTESSIFFETMGRESEVYRFVTDILLDLIERDDFDWRKTRTAHGNAQKRYPYHESKGSRQMVPGQELGNIAFVNNEMTKSIFRTLVDFAKEKSSFLDPFVDDNDSGKQTTHLQRDLDELLHVFEMERVCSALKKIQEENAHALAEIIKNKNSLEPQSSIHVKPITGNTEENSEDTTQSLSEAPPTLLTDVQYIRKPEWMFDNLDTDYFVESPEQAQAVRNEIARNIIKRILVRQWELDSESPLTSDIAPTYLPQSDGKTVIQWIDENLPKQVLLNGLKAWIAMRADPASWGHEGAMQAIQQAFKATPGWEDNFERCIDEIEDIFGPRIPKMRWDWEVERRFGKNIRTGIESSFQNDCNLHFSPGHLCKTDVEHTSKDPRKWNLLQCMARYMSGEPPDYDLPLLTLQLEFPTNTWMVEKGAVFWSIRLMHDIRVLLNNLKFQPWSHSELPIPQSVSYYDHPFDDDKKAPEIDIILYFPFIEDNFQLHEMQHLLQGIMSQKFPNNGLDPRVKWVKNDDGVLQLIHTLGANFGKIVFAQHTDQIPLRIGTSSDPKEDMEDFTINGSI